MKGKKILHISFVAAVSKQLLTSINFVYFQIAQFVTDAEFAKSKVNLIDKALGLLSSFSTFQMLKKVDPPPRKAHLRVEFGGYGYSLLFL